MVATMPTTDQRTLDNLMDKLGLPRLDIGTLRKEATGKQAWPENPGHFPLPAGCRRVCRPNRLDVRHFTPRAAGRIARSAQDNYGTIQTFREIVSQLGLKDTICTVLRLFKVIDKIDDAMSFSRIATALGTIIAALRSILVGEERVPKGPVGRFINRIFGRFTVVLLILAALQLALELVKLMADNLDVWREFRELIEPVCEGD